MAARIEQSIVLVDETDDTQLTVALRKADEHEDRRWQLTSGELMYLTSTELRDFAEMILAVVPPEPGPDPLLAEQSGPLPF